MLPENAGSQASPRPTGPEGAAGDVHVLGALPWRIRGAGLGRLECPPTCRREHRSLFGGPRLASGPTSCHRAQCHRLAGPSGQPSEVTDALSFDLDLDLVPLPWRSGSLDGKNSECPRLLPQLLHGAGPETWISPHGLAGLSGWVWWPPTPLPGRIPRIMRAPGPAQVPGR